MVHPDAICWGKFILVIHLRYEHWSSSVYWNTYGRAGRRALSILWRFVPHHLMYAFNMTEVGSERCLMCIPVAYSGLQTCHESKFEQEPVFSYSSSTMNLNPESGL